MYIIIIVVIIIIIIIIIIAFYLVSSEKFVPQYAAHMRDTEFRINYNEDPRFAAGTVVWQPFSSQSKVSLERGAETPEVAQKTNPFTGIGKTSLLRSLADRYHQYRPSEYEFQPFEPGFIEPAIENPRPCLQINPEFCTDGPYGSGILKESYCAKRNELTGVNVGLGSVTQDPRFEPGPQWRVPGGDANLAHGGHAGGPTMGGLGSTSFLTSGAWSINPIRGFGNREDDIVETSPEVNLQFYV